MKVPLPELTVFPFYCRLCLDTLWQSVCMSSFALDQNHFPTTTCPSVSHIQIIVPNHPDSPLNLKQDIPSPLRPQHPSSQSTLYIIPIFPLTYTGIHHPTPSNLTLWDRHPPHQHISLSSWNRICHICQFYFMMDFLSVLLLTSVNVQPLQHCKEHLDWQHLHYQKWVLWCCSAIFFYTAQGFVLQLQ